ncbi:hypothetical protein bcgnr5388_57500 [Bacillus cereus]
MIDLYAIAYIIQKFDWYQEKSDPESDIIQNKAVSPSLEKKILHAIACIIPKTIFIPYK